MARIVKRFLAPLLALWATVAGAQVADQSVNFGPFTSGYVSSVPAQFAPKTAITGDGGQVTNCSLNTFIDPFTGAVFKRSGTVIVGDAVDGNGLSTTGLLESKWSAKSRQLFALDSPSFTDGYPSHAVLYTNETNPTSGTFPTQDNGFFGTIYAFSTNGSANYQIGKEFGSGTYGTSVRNFSTEALHYFKVVPVWYESGEGGYTRGAFEFARRFFAAGSRKVLQAGNWLYAPNLRATPWRWNKRLNESSVTATDRIRIFPSGPWPPLFTGNVSEFTADSTTANGVWTSGDTYYYSVLFQFEDGSYSMPYLPRPPNATLTSGIGLKVVNSAAPYATTRYTRERWTNIPIGPDGTVARILLRSPKQRRTKTTDSISVSPYDLRILGVLRNNTQTSYDDYLGSDTGLLNDANVVRLDWTLPRRSRYIGTGDQRAIIGYTLPNTSAIMMAPTGSNASRDLNVSDESNNAYPATAFFVTVKPGMLSISKLAAQSSTAQQAAGTHNFDFNVYTTLQSLVDAINATAYTDSAGEWAAQLAPGVDGSTASTSLCVTSQNILNCTATNKVLVCGDSTSFADVPVGARLNGVGAGITAGTYIVSKFNSGRVQLSAAATTSADTVNCYSDTGDNGCAADSTRGYVRAFCPAYPFVVSLKRSALPGYTTPDKRSIYFTVSSPGAASSGISLAPNAFVAGNRRQVSLSQSGSGARALTGIADIEGAAVLAFNDGIQLFINRRGVNSGEDFDYRLVNVNDYRGSIAYDGLVAGNGWASYLTTQGIVALDKNGREFVISNAIHNPTTTQGDLNTAISTCFLSAMRDNDSQPFHASITGTRLRINYQSASGYASQVYDFSSSADASGVEQLLNPDTKQAQPWSAPLLYNAVAAAPFGASGSVVKSSERKEYLCSDDDVGSTGDGRIDQIEKGTTDNAQNITSTAFTSLYSAPPFTNVGPARMEVLHLTTFGSAGQTKLSFANDQAGTFTNALFALPVASTPFYASTQIKLPNGSRGPTNQFWLEWSSTASSSTNKLWQVTVQYGILPQ